MPVMPAVRDVPGGEKLKPPMMPQRKEGKAACDAHHRGGVAVGALFAAPQKKLPSAKTVGKSNPATATRKHSLTAYPIL